MILFVTVFFINTLLFVGNMNRLYVVLSHATRHMGKVLIAINILQAQTSKHLYCIFLCLLFISAKRRNHGTLKYTRASRANISTVYLKKKNLKNTRRGSYKLVILEYNDN